ncbi:MAG TPA: M20 family metallopeptidase [Phycisphaerae bacterium]|nr:M20 family metallopeptidase [Phycisphaerae bacterium]
MRKLTEAEKQRLIQLAQDLVGIDSAITSPEQANRDRTEERMAEYLTNHLRCMGMTVERQEVFPGRPNLMAHWPGQGDKKSLMLEAHMDTVTVEGMTIDPFAAEVRDGRIWGRGTCDTKGNMAAFLTGLEIAYRRGQLPADKLYFVATMSEETCCVGSAALMEHGFRTDAAIVGEATGCRVITAHKAPLWLEIETTGRSCHASIPDQGVNAIEAMVRIVEFIHGPWTRHLQQTMHPLLGQSTMQVTTIEGGSKINIIPSRCRVQVDGRIIPGKNPEEVTAELRRMLADHLGGTASFQILSEQSRPAMDTPPDAPLVRKLMPLCRQAAGQTGAIGVNYFADTGPFTQAGITSVLFGAGDIAQAHTADEFLDLDQLFLATEIMLALLTDNAGRSIVESG